MNRVFVQALSDRTRYIFWWCVGMVSLAGLTALFYPSVRDQAASYQELFESLPEGLLALVGTDDVRELTTPVGLLNSRLFAGIGPVLMAVLGVTLGTGLLVAEERDGSLNMLLAQPISRTKLLLEKFAAGAVSIGIVATLIAIALLVVNPILGLGLPVARVVAANVMLAVVAIVFCAFSLMVGAVTGNKPLTLGLAAGFVAVSFVINGFAELVDGLGWLQRLSPFYWLQASNPLANGIDPGAVAVLLIAVTVFLMVAVGGFGRRDIDT